MSNDLAKVVQKKGDSAGTDPGGTDEKQRSSGAPRDESPSDMDVEAGDRPFADKETIVWVCITDPEINLFTNKRQVERLAISLSGLKPPPLQVQVEQDARDQWRVFCAFSTEQDGQVFRMSLLATGIKVECTRSVDPKKWLASLQVQVLEVPGTVDGAFITALFQQAFGRDPVPHFVIKRIRKDLPNPLCIATFEDPAPVQKLLAYGFVRAMSRRYPLSPAFSPNRSLDDDYHAYLTDVPQNILDRDLDNDLRKVEQTVIRWIRPKAGRYGQANFVKVTFAEKIIEFDLLVSIERGDCRMLWMPMGTPLCAACGLVESDHSCQFQYEREQRMNKLQPKTKPPSNRKSQGGGTIFSNVGMARHTGSWAQVLREGQAQNRVNRQNNNNMAGTNAPAGKTGMESLLSDILEQSRITNVNVQDIQKMQSSTGAQIESIETGVTAL
jgi:hypothetical protein